MFEFINQVMEMGAYEKVDHDDRQEVSPRKNLLKNVLVRNHENLRGQTSEQKRRAMDLENKIESSSLLGSPSKRRRSY